MEKYKRINLRIVNGYFLNSTSFYPKSVKLANMVHFQIQLLSKDKSVKTDLVKQSRSFAGDTYLCFHIHIYVLQTQLREYNI